MAYVIHASLECLVKKTDGWANDPEKYSTRKIGRHIPCGYSIQTIWHFDHIKDKHTLYRWKRLYEKML